MKIMHFTLASVAALALVACASETPAEETAADTTAVADDATPAGTIVEVAQGNADFSTLVTAVTAAELGETLSGTGPFTVFAPTNDAFAKLPAGTVEKLTTEDKDTLKAILTYHVVEGHNRRWRRGVDRCGRQHGQGHRDRCGSVQRHDPRDRHRADAAVIAGISQVMQGRAPDDRCPPFVHALLATMLKAG